MLKLKNILLALALIVGLSSPMLVNAATNNDAIASSVSEVAFTNSDTNSLFGSDLAQNNQIRTLSFDEMSQTQGSSWLSKFIKRNQNTLGAAALIVTKAVFVIAL